jgi:hypothetical protein
MNLKHNILALVGKANKEAKSITKDKRNPSCIHCHLDMLCHMAASSAATLQHLNTPLFVCAFLYVVNVPTIDSWRVKN